jgi:hypothetical protein
VFEAGLGEDAAQARQSAKQMFQGWDDQHVEEAQKRDDLYTWDFV